MLTDYLFKKKSQGSKKYAADKVNVIKTHCYAPKEYSGLQNAHVQKFLRVQHKS